MRILTGTFLLLVLLISAARADEYDEAVKLIKDGKYDVATTLLEAHVAKGNETVRAYYALGFCAEKMDNKKRAYDFYRKSIAINRATGNDPENTKRVYERLFELLPAVKPVIEKAWELEALAGKAEDKSSREYLLGAANNLYEYALNGVTVNPPEAPPVGDDLSTADMEKSLGYRLRLHKVGAKKFEGNGHYYMAFEEKVTWVQAYARCKEMGGYLVTITSPEEAAFVEAMVTDHTWIGATDRHVERTWKWVTGESFEFTRWQAGQPDNAKGTVEEDAALLHNTPGYAWSDKPIDRPSFFFICEWND